MFLDSLAAAIPADTGTDAYTEPAAEDEVNWKLAVKRVLESDFSSAHASADHSVMVYISLLIPKARRFFSFWLKPQGV